MFLSLIPRCRFYWRRLLVAHPVLLPGLLAAALSAAVAGGVCIWQQQQRGLLQQQRTVLAQQFLAVRQSLARPAMPTDVLADFQSTTLVAAVNQVAADAHLPLDDVSFALDDTPSLPYLRYRATLTVTADYPAVRHFIEQMQTALHDVSLDTVSCSRDAITVPELTCDLGLSVFYRKTPHG